MFDNRFKLYILFFYKFSYIIHIFLNYKTKVIDLIRFNHFISFLEYVYLDLYLLFFLKQEITFYTALTPSPSH